MRTARGYVPKEPVWCQCMAEDKDAACLTVIQVPIAILKEEMFCCVFANFNLIDGSEIGSCMVDGA